jgi:hypothetical protein
VLCRWEIMILYLYFLLLYGINLFQSVNTAHMAWWTKLLSLVYGRGVFIIDICRCSMNLNGVYFYFLLVLHPISLVGVLRLESKVSFLRGLIKNWAFCQWIELDTISDFVSFLYLLLFFRVVMDCDWDFNFSIIELSSIVF